ncbi:MAG: hypothetical protein IIY21_26955 [Clostridiales bacterium]|nr:hypothetical protein [Clostridiales bacterium]
MRLIDADELKVRLTELGWTSDNGFDKRMYIDDIIDNSPTVERPSGEWIEKPWGVVCSRCKAQALHTPNGNQSRSDYCPDCGASMRKEGETK